MKHLSRLLCALTALSLLALASCAGPSRQPPPPPHDWDTEFLGNGSVLTIITNQSSRSFKLRLVDTAGTTAGQVQMHGNGRATLRLAPGSYDAKIRVALPGDIKYYRAPRVSIPINAASVSLTLILSSSTNLQEISEAEFNR
ncbi:MAG: hypothetical protein ACO1TE_17420 [Prosthecobacter sp.]